MLQTQLQTPLYGPQSPGLAQTSSLDLGPEDLDRIAQKCRDSLYFLGKFVLGFSDFNQTLHTQMCLEAQDSSQPRCIHLEPRGHFKTSIYSITKPIWHYINNPNIRILIAGSTATNASKRLARIQRVFESNELFRLLFPSALPPDFRSIKWNQFEAQLPRTREYVECTFEAMGVGGKVTGRHYDIIIKDDLIDETCLGPDGIPTLTSIEDAFRWHEYSEALFDPPEKGIDCVVGTRWGLNDLYDRIADTDKRYKVFVRGATDKETGLPIFPERFSSPGLAAIQVRNPYLYACQYENNPTDATIVEFDSKWFPTYQLDSTGRFVGRNIPSAKPILPAWLDKIVIVDPACSEKRKADDTGMVVLGSLSTPDGVLRVFVLETWNGKFEPEPMIRRMRQLYFKWSCRAAAIESVAAQRVFNSFCNYISRAEGKYVNVIEVKPGGRAKHARIRGLLPYARTGQIYLPEGALELRSQISHFPHGPLHLLDAMAYGPSLWGFGHTDEDDRLEELVEEELARGRHWRTGY